MNKRTWSVDEFTECFKEASKNLTQSGEIFFDQSYRIDYEESELRAIEDAAWHLKEVTDEFYDEVIIFSDISRKRMEKKNGLEKANQK